MADAKATTVRFASEIYERLEKTSRTSGLPINSIVVVAVLEWLEAHPPELIGRGSGFLPVRPRRLGRRLPWPASPQAFDQFSRSAQSALARAQEIAEASGEGHITTGHLLLAVARTGLAAKVLRTLGVTDEQLGQPLLHSTGQPIRGLLLPTTRVRTVIKLALEEAQAAHLGYVGTEHLLLGIAREGESEAARLLLELGIDEDAVRAQIAELVGAEET
ncbi:MAG TPA: Clp protease N-terminal domain-containing protein [Candidatus Dormibacteraeota bacterium]